MRKKQYPFFTYKLGVKDMAHINIKMHVRYAAFSTHKQHGIFFYKTTHQVFGPAKIAGYLRRMLKNVEKKNSKVERAGLYFAQVIAKFHISICRIDGRIRVA